MRATLHNMGCGHSLTHVGCSYRAILSKDFLGRGFVLTDGEGMLVPSCLCIIFLGPWDIDRRDTVGLCSAEEETI